MAIAKAQVIIQLKDQLSEGTRRATKELAQLGKVAEGIKGAFRFAGELNQAAEGMSRFGALARSALEVPVKTAMDFEDQMARVGALADASAGSMAMLTENARALGRDTRFSATEAAQGMEFLAQSGFKTSEIIAAMPGVLATAAANVTGLGRTAEIAADSMNGFGLQATQMGRVGDVLTKAGAESSTNLEMIGESLKYVAPIARTAGYSIEQTAAAVALLANVGIKGSQSGTALRAMISGLAAPRGRGKEALAFLGINPKDKKGNIRPIEEILKQIDAAIISKKVGSGDKLALYKHIFGEEAATAAAELVSRAGDGAFGGMIAKMNEAAGTNDKMSARMNATTKGLIAELESSWEDLNIELGDTLGPDIRALGASMRETAIDATKWVTENRELVSTLGKIALGVAGVGTVMGGIATVASAMATSFGILRVATVPLAAAVKALAWALNQTAIGGAAVTALTVPIAGGIAGITAPMVALGVAVAYVSYEIAKLVGADDLGNWIGDQAANLAGFKRPGAGGMNAGDQEFADGTRLDKDGNMLRKGTEWERHAAGLSVQDWKAKQAASAPPVAAPGAESNLRIDVDVRDNRTHVKTSSKSKGGNVSVGSGPMLPGAL